MAIIQLIAILVYGFLAGASVTSAVLATGLLIGPDDGEEELNLTDARRRELKRLVGILWAMAAITVAACVAVVWRG